MKFGCHGLCPMLVTLVRTPDRSGAPATNVQSCCCFSPRYFLPPLRDPSDGAHLLEPGRVLRVGVLIPRVQCRLSVRIEPAVAPLELRRTNVAQTMLYCNYQDARKSLSNMLARRLVHTKHNL